MYPYFGKWSEYSLSSIAQRPQRYRTIYKYRRQEFTGGSLSWLACGYFYYSSISSGVYYLWGCM